MAEKTPRKRTAVKRPKSARSTAAVTKKKSPANSKPAAAPVPSPTTEITIMDANAGTLLADTKRDSLLAWFELYMTVEVTGAEGTVKEKLTDLGQFYSYFQQVSRTDHIDQWTRSITSRYQSYLWKDLKRKPNTVNRRLSTLKHAARWIHSQRKFLAGNPTAKIPELDEAEPVWEGLTPIQITRVKAAAEQLLHIRRRQHHRPYRNYAVFIILLNTGLRISELLRLQLDQYDGKHFKNVRRKGKSQTRKVFLNREAREALDRYLDEDRGREPGWIFVTNGGDADADPKPLDRFAADAILKAIQNQANGNLPDDEKFYWSAHTLRHTYLRDVANNHGVHRAKEVSGHASDRYIWRYVKPSDEEVAEINEGLYAAVRDPRGK